MNLPTKITVTRILMLPVLIVLFCLETHFYGIGNKQTGDILCFVTSLLYIATALTDFLDGYLARKYNQVTTLGKFLDPIADKVCVLTGLVFIMQGNFIYGMPYVAMICTIVIIARELIIGLFRQIAASKKMAENTGTTLEDMERRMIADAIKKYGGNLSLTAEKLGITRQTLYNKMKRFNIG